MNEYDQKIGNLKRRRGLLDALTEQSLTPDQGKMVGQVYVGPSLLDALAKPLAAGIASYGQDRLDKQEAELTQQRQTGLLDALTQARQSGNFGEQALVSDYPELQQLGKMTLAAQLKGETPEKFGTSFQTVVGPDGKLQNVQLGNRGSVKPLDGYSAYEKPSFVGGEAVIPSQAVPGQLYGREPKGTQVNVNMPQETARDKKLGELEAGQIDAARQQRLAAQRTFNMATKLEELDRNGVLSGPTAKPLMFAGQLARGLGLQLPAEAQQLLTNSENFNQTIGTQISDMILNSSAGRGFTDTDRDYVEKSFPTMMQTPEGRKQALTFLKEAAVRGADEGRAIEEGIRSGNPLNVDPTGGRMDEFRNRGQGGRPQTFNIQSQEEFDGLPSGALFVGPDGKTRRKP